MPPGASWHAACLPCAQGGRGVQSIQRNMAPVTTAGPVARTLDVEDLTVRYGQALAADGVTLAIQPGEAAALPSPSGCGRATRLPALAASIPRSPGRVLGAAAPPHHLPAN